MASEIATAWVLALGLVWLTSSVNGAEATGESPATRPARVGPIYVEDGGGRAQSPRNAEPLLLKPGPQLFLDDYLIESSRNVSRRPVTLQRDPAIGNPIVTGAHLNGGAEGDRNFQPWLSILRDPQSGRFRIWYNIGIDSGTSRIGYMESDDGIHWQRPHRELSKPDNVIFCDAVIDEGPAFQPPAERFKMAFYSKAHRAEIWASPDGLEWSFFSPGPAPTNDIINLVRDAARGRYLLTHGAPTVPEDGYKGHTQNSKDTYRRLVGQSSSTDCRHWTPPHRIIMPGKGDEGITEFYGVGGLLCRGDLIVGTLKVLRDDLPCDPNGEVHGIGYTTVAWTRDGEHWTREKEPLVDRDHTPGSWDHAHTWVDCQLPVGDEVYLYYGGYKGGHKVNRMEERQVGLVRMKRDRYVAREAGDETGTLRTPPLVLHGKELSVNVECVADGGELRVQLVGADDQPIKGYSFDECPPIRSDQVSAPVRWSANGRLPADLAGKPVRLEFSLKRARIYAFDLQ